MQRIVSAVMTGIMLLSSCPMVFAASQSVGWEQGTQVVYTASQGESYTVTVPAQLAPGANGIVTLEGTWANNRIVTVTADKTVILTNSILATDTKTLNVNFGNGIAAKGSNIGSQTFEKDISVDDIQDAIFGQWSGRFNYYVDIEDCETEKQIAVSAKDSNGNDLNATSTTIVGDEKTDLLSKLENSNLIESADDVDALIEVESDDFDDLADTTFDVSSIAKEGDKVVILHFDETKQEWEFVAEETVDANGKVNANFSSYSPVAFVVVKPDGSTEIIVGGVDHNGTIIPDGATYKKADGAVLNAGDAFPEITAGDIYTYGDYEYCYGYRRQGSCCMFSDLVWWSYECGCNFTCDGWAVHYIGNDAKPTPMLERINGELIMNMESTFEGCDMLEVSPEIPKAVTSMRSTFAYCSNLTSVPDLSHCADLTNMDWAFFHCTSLEKAPILPSALTHLGSTFQGCTSLKTAPYVPVTVWYFDCAFSECTSLTGVVEINMDVGYYQRCFDGVDFENQKLTLIGKSSKLDDYGKTGVNYCENCNGYCKGGHEQPVEIIEFTIEDHGTTIQCQAEKGMTWEQWVLSDYNNASVTLGPIAAEACIRGLTIAHGNPDPYGTTVYGEDVIDNTLNYYVSGVTVGI